LTASVLWTTSKLERRPERHAKVMVGSMVEIHLVANVQAQANRTEMSWFLGPVSALRARKCNVQSKPRK
jgi:hypothetical protein